MTSEQLEKYNALHDKIESLADDISDLDNIENDDDYKSLVQFLRDENRISMLRLWALHYLSLLHHVTKETNAIHQLNELLEEKLEEFESL